MEHGGKHSPQSVCSIVEVIADHSGCSQRTAEVLQYLRSRLLGRRSGNVFNECACGPGCNQEGIGCREGPSVRLGARNSARSKEDRVFRDTGVVDCSSDGKRDPDAMNLRENPRGALKFVTGRTGLRRGPPVRARDGMGACHTWREKHQKGGNCESSRSYASCFRERQLP